MLNKTQFSVEHKLSDIRVWSLNEVEVEDNKFNHNMTKKVSTHQQNYSNCVNGIEREGGGAELNADYS
jgi:hypothetical protein